MEKSPIAFFVYNRPEHTKKVLESLAANKESKESELYVFIDGPRNHDDRIKIEQIKVILDSQQWCKNISVYESQNNKGCAGQLIEVLNRLFQKTERMIILEDDNLLSPHFLEFINKGLEKYAFDEKVMGITGYMFPIKKVGIESGFLRLCGSWGWGTWRRAWKLFESDSLKLLEKLSSQRIKYEFNCRGSFDYYKMLLRQANGEIDSWSIRWYASLFLENGLTLHPAKSLVRNIGFDGSGTNTYKNKRYDTDFLTSPIEKLPETIEESEVLFSATVDYFRKNHNVFCKIYDRLKNLRDLKITSKYLG